MTENQYSPYAIIEKIMEIQDSMIENELIRLCTEGCSFCGATHIDNFTINYIDNEFDSIHCNNCNNNHYVNIPKWKCFQAVLNKKSRGKEEYD